MKNIYFKIQRAIACLLIQQKKKLNLSEAVVSFTFDDVENSAFINGASILKKYGFQGTYYLSLGLCYKNKPVGGIFDSTLMAGIVNDGGELACHTYSHIKLYKSSKKEIVQDLVKNQEEMNKIIPGYKFTSFAYPYGQQTITSKLITRNVYKSSRSIKGGGINLDPVDCNNLKAVGLDKRRELSEIYSLIERAVELKAWLIFYSHDIKNGPATSGDIDYFESIVKYCFDKKIQVRTIEKTLKNIEK